VVGFANNNLHVVGYSIPIDTKFTLEELQPHLHSIPEQPDPIPYGSSGYHRNWGFCLPDRQRQQSKAGTYRVHIDSTLEPGSLTYAELIFRGKVKNEIFISTYVYHPSRANNELSGPMVALGLATWLMDDPDHH